MRMALKGKRNPRPEDALRDAGYPDDGGGDLRKMLLFGRDAARIGFGERWESTPQVEFHRVRAGETGDKGCLEERVLV